MTTSLNRDELLDNVVREMLTRETWYEQIFTPTAALLFEKLDKEYVTYLVYQNQ